MQTKQELLQDYIEQSRYTVFFGGAGVSTESGLPDFRSADGIYQMKYPYPPEEILSHEFFFAHTEEFYQFYREKIVLPAVSPNITHIKLAQMQSVGKLMGIITQNIDGLHQAAGSQNVYELHGSIHRNHCLRCKKAYSLADILGQEGVPRCECGGIIKPDVVLYGEELESETLRGAICAISRADLLIVGGTSLSVYPAAGLLRYFQGKRLVVINQTATPMDARADLCFSCKLGDVFGRISL